MSGTVCGKLVHYSSAPTCNPQCDIFSKHSDCDTDVMSSLDCSEMLTAAKTDSSSIWYVINRTYCNKFLIIIMLDAVMYGPHEVL